MSFVSLSKHATHDFLGLVRMPARWSIPGELTTSMSFWACFAGALAKSQVLRPQATMMKGPFPLIDAEDLVFWQNVLQASGRSSDRTNP